jgi:multimeric flavodoxin WrbA
VTQNPNKHLLIVFHSQSGNTEQLIEAANRGANNGEIDGVDVRMLMAINANPDDLLWADGLILGTAENFGYMSGAIKDFLDRTYYEVEGKIQSLPYALIVSADNDGSGAVRSVQRIAKGYPFIAIQEPLVVVGEIDAQALESAHDLGMLLAAGLESGVF